MEKGFIWKKKLRQGFFCKRAKGGGVSLRNKREGRGFWAKSPPFFLLPPDQNRGREWGCRRRQSRRLGARGWLRSGGEGRERPARSIPGRSLGGGGLGRPGRDGVRRRAWGGTAELVGGPDPREKGGEGLGGPDAHLGLGCGAAGRGSPRWPVLGAAVMVSGGAGSSGWRSWSERVALGGLL